MSNGQTCIVQAEVNSREVHGIHGLQLRRERRDFLGESEAREQREKSKNQTQAAIQCRRLLIVFNVVSTNFAAITRPVFGRAAQNQPAPPKPLRTKAEARYQRAARTAAELLPELPEPGEAVHALMLGTFDLMQVITATMRFVPTCSHLRIATLCFSKRNAAELLGLLESFPQLRLTMLVSEFFKGHNAELFEKFADEMKMHPTARLAAARTHAKVVIFDLGAEDGLVFEGSANLRTNGNREQLAVFRDRCLHDFHAEWIDQMVKADG